MWTSLICLLVVAGSYVAVANPSPAPDCNDQEKQVRGIPQNAEILILESENGELTAVNTNAIQQHPRKQEPEMEAYPKKYSHSKMNKRCSKNEVFSSCKSQCQRFCDLESGTIRFPNDCSGKCIPGCACKKGYVMPPADAPFKDCISWETCTGLIEAASETRDH